MHQLQESKDLSKPRNKHYKKRNKNATHCFIYNRKELPIHWSTINDIFHDVFMMLFRPSTSYIFVGAT